jgi:signal transduction histidine kinase
MDAAWEMTERRQQAESSMRARWRFLLVLGGSLFLLVGAAAVYARSCLGRPFPGLFTDPYGSFSAVWWPGWGAESVPLHFPDRLIAIDGAPASAGTGAAVAASRRLSERYAAGQREVTLTFATRHGTVAFGRRLRQLGAEEAVFFFGLYALIALFVAWSGLAVMLLARRRSGAIAYAWWSVGTSVFLICFFDYHTTTRLAPLFTLSTVCTPVFLAWLAYSFPAPPRRRRRALGWAVRAFGGLGAMEGACLLLGPRLGRDVTGVRVLVGLGGLFSLLVLLVAILVRAFTGSRERQREVRTAVWGLAVAPGSLAVGFFAIVISGTGLVHVLLPFLAPLLPLSVGYSLIQHNILGTTAVLSRRIMLAPIVVVAGAGAIVAWLAIHALLRWRDLSPFIPWASALAALVTLSWLGHRLSVRVLSPTRGKFRPTIAQLADDLASNHQAAVITRAISEAVLRWLPTEQAQVIFPGELHHIPHRPKGYREALAAGEAVWTGDTPWKRHLLLPMRSQGELRGVMRLAPKHRAALYTREDLDLLEIIASLGAVALQNASVISELDTFRRFEVGAAHDEKRLALGLLSAEIAHEIAYPLNFLRYLLAQGSAGRALAAQDIEIGREEIGRLERMFSTLSKLRIPLPRVEPVLVLPRARRALDLMRETILSKDIRVTLDVPPDLTVVAEPDPLVQIFANLLRNAAQAVEPGQEIGITASRQEGGMAFEVWDVGPGIQPELEDRIFDPFITGKEGSMGLGLAVTERLVRSFGWTISVSRRGERTTFRIEVPGGGL